MKVPEIIKQPTTWIWVIASYLLLLHILKFAAVIGPPILFALIGDTDNSISWLDLKNATSYYLQAATESTSSDTTTLKYLLVYSGISSLLFVSFSLQLGLRKSYARIIILILIGVEVILEATLSIYTNTLPSWDTSGLYILIFCVLLLPVVSRNFQEAA